MQLRAKTPMGWAVRGCIVLLGLSLFGCIGIFAFGLILQATGYEAPATAVAVVQATDVPLAPTSAPEPTLEPTLEPTVVIPTLEPTAAISPSEADAAIQYLDQLQSAFEPLPDAMQEMGKLLGAPDLTSDDWKVDVAIQIAAIRQVDDDVKAINPPPIMADTHVAATDASAECRNAVDLLAAGIDSRNNATLVGSGRSLTTCIEKINLMTEKMRQATQ